MKKHSYIIYSLMAAMLTLLGTQAKAQTWDFSTLSDADKTLLNADATNWSDDATNTRYNYLNAIKVGALTANGTEIAYTKGLRFSANAGSDATNGKIRLNYGKGQLELNGTDTIFISGLKKDNKITVVCQTTSKTAARGFNVVNITPQSGSFNATSVESQTNVGVVTADGDVTLMTTGGMAVQSIIVATDGGGTTPGGGGDTGGGTISGDHSTTLNSKVTQLQITTTGNVLKYYNCSDLQDVTIDKATNKVSVNTKTSGVSDVYDTAVGNITFTKAETGGGSGDITNKGVQITEAKGWNESVYAKWDILSGASSYNVYVKGGAYADYTKIDDQLVRNYGTYGRADMVGLKAGTGYALKVVPVISGSEDASKASFAENLEVKNYNRAGFAHLNNAGVGAYNDDGTLKSDARVLYVTASTAKTVSLDMITGKNSATTTLTGLQAIINAYQKGLETRPLDIRLIGTIKNADMDALESSAEGLQVKGKGNGSNMYLTIEGIGEDAGFYGFGMLLRYAVNVELRNFAVMLCLDDALSLDTENKYCWIHNMDLFYGKTGSAADQVKGDGTVDVKANSQYITIAYNHLFDNGKSSLCGMKSESGPNYIDYNHNWFDHSDSRHPRVRTMTVHVWNNYYDGCAKYGVGATTGSSVFVEGNYFRDTKDPMLISGQGTDAKGTGTFSGETGGMIKSFGNVYAEKGTSSNFTPITQNESATSFDCYETTTRDEQVPSSVVTLKGGTSYDNFDTNNSLMYKYTPDAGNDVPSVVKGFYGAGRLNKGDFSWTFTNSTDDASYDVNTALKSALTSYTSKLVGFFK